jgi:hypothetical protein
MWLFARTMLPPWGAALAASAYVLAPFHLVNVYVRGDSLSEFWAFAWFPLILWGVEGVVRTSAIGRLASGTASVTDAVQLIAHRRIDARPMPYTLALSLSLAALVLTHNVSALIFAPFIVIYALAVLARGAMRSGAGAFVRGLLWLAGAAALGLALGAWFWLPALSEAPAAQLGDQTTGFFNYANHFRGAGLVQSTLAFDYAVNEDGGAFAMGLAQALLIATGTAAWMISNARAKRSQFWPVLTFALFGLATLMITPHSAAIWAGTPLLPLAQFPWRFLSVQAVFGAALVGGLWAGVADPRSVIRIPGWIVLAAVLALLLWSALAGLPNERLNVRAEDVTPRSIQLYEWYTGNVGTTIRAEYLPATAQPRPWVGPDLLGQPPQALVAQDGVTQNAVASVLQFALPHEQIWRITAAQPVRIVLPAMYSPAWAAERDGARDAPSPLAIEPYEGSGWISLFASPGEHVYRIFMQDTWRQRIGEWISLVALGLIAVVTIVLIVRLPPDRREPVALAATIGGGIVAVTLLLGWSLGPAPAPAPMQTLDLARRPFPHRDPVVFTGAGGAAYELIGARIEPHELRAGDPFTLTLRWRDDRAPAIVTATQELPMGAEFATLFRHARAQSAGDPRLSTHRVLAEALPGPLLLKLSASDSAGPLVAQAPDGTPLHTAVAGHPASAATLLGPTITAAMGDAPAQTVVDFDNGLALGAMDWFFASANDVCFRPEWRAVRADRNRADALQASIRLRGHDGRMIAQADSQPQAGLAPTWSWPDGATIHDGQCVPIVDLLEPGEPYTVQIVWYRLADLKPTGEATLRGERGAALNDLNVPRP